MTIGGGGSSSSVASSNSPDMNGTGGDSRGTAAPPSGGASQSPSGNGGDASALTTLTQTSATALAAASSTVCPLCGEQLREPKVLACFHTFCRGCLEKLVDEAPSALPHLLQQRRSVTCPVCQAETQLVGVGGVDSLLCDYAALNLLCEEQQRHCASAQQESLTNGSGGAEDHPPTPPPVPCTGCKTKDSPAVAHCYDCSNALCANCVAAHKYMHCFEGHRMIDLAEMELNKAQNGGGNSGGHQVPCMQHAHEPLQYFCFTCNVPICQQCTLSDHSPAQHHYENIGDVSALQIDYMHRLLEEAKLKQATLMQAFKSVDSCQKRLNVCLEKAQLSLAETVCTLQQIIEEQRQQSLRDLDTSYTSKQSTLNLLDRKLQQTTERLGHVIDFTTRLLRFATPTEALVFKKLLETRLKSMLGPHLDLDQQLAAGHFDSLGFAPNMAAIRMAIGSAFVARNANANEMIVNPMKVPVKPISRPVVGSLPSNGSSPPILGTSFPTSIGSSSALSPMGGGASLAEMLQHHQAMSMAAGGGQCAGGGGMFSVGDLMGHVTNNGNGGMMGGGVASSFQSSQFSPPPMMGASDLVGCGNSFGLTIGASQPHHTFSDSNLLNAKHLGGSTGSIGPFSSLATTENSLGGCSNVFDKWPPLSAGTTGSDFSALSTLYGAGGASAGTTNPLSEFSCGSAPGRNPFFSGSTPGSYYNNGADQQQIVDLTAGKGVSAALFPPKSQVKRQKMIYHCKFGEFGVMEGQFTEPSGVAVNGQNDIVVADTNNHRIQIFDKEGRFKFQFGECGKRDGQLLYPNRVAVNKATGDIVVTERSPTHQIQVYNQYGQFLRKFGANILQHPRGVTVDYKSRVVVVECKVMRVIIFDMMGNVLQKFGCSKYLEFPNGVVTNDKQEIFISDNRAHCVKVFNYDGAYVRQIGGEGLTNYPIGVGVNSAGEIVVADNHNNFNITIFHQDGSLVGALESKVKHAQCFDVSLLDDGSIVLASKDYRLYIYRYVQLPALPM